MIDTDMAPETLYGGCYCGNVSFRSKLTSGFGSYAPRACDCDFCLKHSAAWLSDSEGKLGVTIKDWAKLSRYQQGTGNAEFLVCRDCGVLVVVVYQKNGVIHGAINSKVVETPVTFGDEITVSPRKLDGDQKIRRWQDIWFRDVTITFV